MYSDYIETRRSSWPGLTWLDPAIHVLSCGKDVDARDNGFPPTCRRGAPVLRMTVINACALSGDGTNRPEVAREPRIDQILVGHEAIAIEAPACAP